MVRYKPTFRFKVVSAIILVCFVKASTVSSCMWCDQAMSQQFLSCVSQNDPMFENVNQGTVEDMKSSIMAASQAMTKSSPAIRMELVNGLWAGELYEMMKMQPTFKNPADADMMQRRSMGVMARCYSIVGGKSGESFASDMLKNFDYRSKNSKISSDTELYNSEPYQTQAQSSATSFAQTFNYQAPNYQAPEQQANRYQPSYNNIPPTQQNSPVQAGFNQNGANAVSSSNSYSYGKAPSGQQPITLNGTPGPQNYQLYNFDAPQQQQTFQAIQTGNQPYWRNQQPYDNLQSPEQKPGAQPTISQSSANAKAASLTNTNETPYGAVPLVEQPQNTQSFYLNNIPNMGQDNEYRDTYQNIPINNAPNSDFQQNDAPWNVASNDYPNSDSSGQLNDQNSNAFPKNQYSNSNDDGRNLSPGTLNPQPYNETPNFLQGRPNRNRNQQKKASNNDDETSKAVKFAETCFVTLSQSDIFSTVFHEYTPKNSAANIAYNIIFNALSDCGYKVIAKEIASKTSSFIKKIKRKISTATYAEAMSKVLMVQFDKKGLLENNPDDQAKYIADTMLQRLSELTSQFSIKPPKDTGTSAVSRSSATEMTNVKTTKDPNPSSYIEQNNVKDFSNYPISNDYPYSNYDSQTIQGPTQNQQDGYDDYSQATRTPAQQYNNYYDYKPYDYSYYSDSSNAQDNYNGDSTATVTRDSYDDSTRSTTPETVQVPKQNSSPGYSRYNNNNGDDYVYSSNNQDFGNNPYAYQYPISKTAQKSKQQKQQPTAQLTSGDQKSSENFDRRTPVNTAVANSSSGLNRNRSRNKNRRRNRKRKDKYKNEQSQSGSNAVAESSQNDYPINSGKQTPSESIPDTQTDVPNDYQEPYQVLSTGGKSSEPIENIDILMKSVQKGMSNKEFDYQPFINDLAKLSKDEQVKHPELTPQEAKNKILMEGIVALTNLLRANQNSCTDKSGYSQNEDAPNSAESNLPNTSVEKTNFIQSEQGYPSTVTVFNPTQPNVIRSPIDQSTVGQTDQGNSAVPQNNFNYYSTGQITENSYPSNVGVEPVVGFNNRPFQQPNPNIQPNKQGNLEQPNNNMNYYPTGQGTGNAVWFDNRPLQQPNPNTLQNKQGNSEQQNNLNYYSTSQGPGNFYPIGQGNNGPQPTIGLDNRPPERPTNQNIQQSNPGNSEQQNMWRIDYQIVQNHQLPPMNNMINQNTFPQFQNGIMIPNTIALGNQPNMAFQSQGVPNNQNFMDIRNQAVTNSISTKNSNSNALYQNDNTFTQNNMQQSGISGIPYGQSNYFPQNQQLNNGYQTPQSNQISSITNNFANQQFPVQPVPMRQTILGQESSSGLANGFASFQTQASRPTNAIQSNMLLGNQVVGQPNNQNLIDTRNQAVNSPTLPVNLNQNVPPLQNWGSASSNRQ